MGRGSQSTVSVHFLLKFCQLVLDRRLTPWGGSDGSSKNWCRKGVLKITTFFPSFCKASAASSTPPTLFRLITENGFPRFRPFCQLQIAFFAPTRRPRSRPLEQLNRPRISAERIAVQGCRVKEWKCRGNVVFFASFLRPTWRQKMLRVVDRHLSPLT